jgi:hypothetical protein
LATNGGNDFLLSPNATVRSASTDSLPTIAPPDCPEPPPEPEKPCPPVAKFRGLMEKNKMYSQVGNVVSGERGEREGLSIYDGQNNSEHKDHLAACDRLLR